MTSTVLLGLRATMRNDGCYDADKIPDAHEAKSARDRHAMQTSRESPSSPKSFRPDDAKHSPDSSALSSGYTSAQTVHFVGIPYKIPITITMVREAVQFCGVNYNEGARCLNQYEPLENDDSTFNITKNPYLRAITTDTDDQSIKMVSDDIE